MPKWKKANPVAMSLKKGQYKQQKIPSGKNYERKSLKQQLLRSMRSTARKG